MHSFMFAKVLIYICCFVYCMVSLFALFSWYFCISVDCMNMKSMYSYMFTIILMVYLLFCKLYGMFVCPDLKAHLYICRLYESLHSQMSAQIMIVHLLFCKLQAQNIIYLKPIQPFCPSQPFNWCSEADPGHAIPLLFKKYQNTAATL